MDGSSWGILASAGVHACDHAALALALPTPVLYKAWDRLC
jgi:hypothetical protein